MSILMDFLQQYVEDIAIDIKNQKNIVDYVDTYSDFTSKYDVSKPDSLTISVGDYVRVLSDYTNADEIMDYKLTKDSSGNYKFVEDLSALDYADIDDRGGTKLYKNNSIYNPEDWLDEVLLQVDDNNCGYTNIEEVLGDLDSLDMVSSFDNIMPQVSPKYVKIQSISNTEFTFAIASDLNATLEYSLDNSTYSTVTKDSAITANNGVLYLRGIGNTTFGNLFAKLFYINCSTNDIKVSGNILNLLDYQNNPTSMNNYIFSHLFTNNTCISDCSELILPEFTSSYCYQSMFEECTNLTSAPELPATTLASNCYESMFYGCTSLTSAPALLATTLADSCYYGMFQGCTNLTSAPELPATTLADSCYRQMFLGCTSLITLSKLPATDLPNKCYQTMFYECTSIKLSTTKTDKYINEYRIPSTGTIAFDDYCMDDMFTGTSGTFTGTPEINTTYYTSNIIV